ncbi:MAG: hypothetical protein PHS14_20795 [Elusimicrobia bacterium]|nr:hypothetical protein [Elusimicrobiota bacterium]
MSLRDEIFALKPGREAVTIPGVTGPVYVRGLTLAERQSLDDSCYSGEGKDRKQDLTRFRPGLLRRTVEGEDGVLLFSDVDEPALARLPADVMEPVFDVALRLSGLDRKTERQIEGNSGAGQSAGVSSTSPNGSA